MKTHKSLWPLTAAFPLFFCLHCTPCSLMEEWKGALSPAAQAESVDVSFRASLPSTKGAVSGEGDAVRRLDLVVFRHADGELDYKGYAEDAEGVSSICATVTANRSLDWWIVANAPASLLDGVTDEESFLANVTLLSHTTSATMVMHASGTDTFTELYHSISATLYRYTCKVSVQGVSVRYLDSFGAVPSCILETVALVNARGQCPLDGTPSGASSGSWYNCSEIDGALTGIAADCLVASPSLAIGSSAKAALSVELYCMPNPSTAADNAATDAAASRSWAPRATRIVLGLRIGGVLQWYPIDLPSMVGNRHYVVSDVVINGPGTSAPDMGVDYASVSYGVSIQTWESENHNVGFGT